MAKDGVRCKKCGWHYFEAPCSCTLPKEERVRRANKTSDMRRYRAQEAGEIPLDPCRYERDEVI